MGFTRIVNGVLRTFAEASFPAIYDQTVTINSKLTTGSSLSLPLSGTFTVSSGVSSLNVFLNGQKLILGSDFSGVGAGPSYTSVQFTFDLNITDVLEFKKERAT